MLEIEDPSASVEKKIQSITEMVSPVKSPNNLQINNTVFAEDDEPIQRVRKRIQKISESDSDSNQDSLKINRSQTGKLVVSNAKLTTTYIFLFLLITY